MAIGIDLFSLTDMTALVTGASGYLGQAMSQILAEAGARVLINGKNPTRVNQLTKHLKQQGLKAESAIFDVTNLNDINRFFESRTGQPLHILVNNAYRGGSGNIICSEPLDYINSFDVTVVAAHNLLKFALPHLRNAIQRDGLASVINIASMYAITTPDQRAYDSAQTANPPFYGASKAALLNWTRYAACEFGRENIRVNSISPGAFPSNRVRQSNPEFVAKLNQKVPMGRVGLAEELKGPILFLASRASSYVNGANIVVDGGWTCW